MLQSWCFLQRPVNHKGGISGSGNIFSWTWDFRCYLQTPVVFDCCVPHAFSTHAHTQKKKSTQTFTCNAKDPQNIHQWLKTIQEGENDHYDTCYGNDNDEYEEYSGSIDSGEGRGGGGLIARELSYSVWFIQRQNSRGYTMIHYHLKMTTLAWSIPKYALLMVFSNGLKLWIQSLFRSFSLFFWQSVTISSVLHAWVCELCCGVVACPTKARSSGFFCGKRERMLQVGASTHRLSPVVEPDVIQATTTVSCSNHHLLKQKPAEEMKQKQNKANVTMCPC